MDIERFRFPASTTLFHRKQKTAIARYTGKFVKGPLPLDWFIRAAQLPGKALHVGVALWYQAGVTRNIEVRCPMSLLTRQMAVSRHSVYRALIALEKAALIAVERHPGRSPVCRLSVQPESTDGIDPGRQESVGSKTGGGIDAL